MYRRGTWRFRRRRKTNFAVLVDLVLGVIPCSVVDLGLGRRGTWRIRVVGLAGPGLGNLVAQEHHRTCRIQTLQGPSWYLALAVLTARRGCLASSVLRVVVLG